MINYGKKINQKYIIKNYLQLINIIKKVYNHKKTLFLFNLIYLVLFHFFIENKNRSNEKSSKQFSHFQDYSTSKFIIMKRRCDVCGLFSFFIVHLGCIHKYILKGYIPIVDVKSYPNSFNGYNISKTNYWEIFFEQPFGYRLDDVLTNAKHLKYIALDSCEPRPDEFTMIDNNPRKHFWHNFANKYLPIKKEIIVQSKKLMFKLFKNSKNILGVLARGTDYIAMRPGGHPIPPNSSEIINDVKKMDNKYNYDYIVNHIINNNNQMIK